MESSEDRWDLSAGQTLTKDSGTPRPPWRMPLVLLTDLWASLSLLENQLVTRFQTGGQFTFQAEAKNGCLTSASDSFRGCLPCLPCAYHLLPGWVVISGDTYSVRLRHPHRFRSDTFTWLAPDIHYITVHCDINSDWAPILWDKFHLPPCGIESGRGERTN